MDLRSAWGRTQPRPKCACSISIRSTSVWCKWPTYITFGVLVNQVIDGRQQTCVTNLLGQADALGCPVVDGQPDALCLCSNADFGYGVRDCSIQACPAGTDTNSIISYGLAYCGTYKMTFNRYLLVVCRLPTSSKTDTRLIRGCCGWCIFEHFFDGDEFICIDYLHRIRDDGNCNIAHDGRLAVYYYLRLHLYRHKLESIHLDLPEHVLNKKPNTQLNRFHYWI